MTQDQAEMLTNFGGEIHEGYSGRGMFGKETYGVEFDSQHNFNNAIADAIEEFVGDANEEEAAMLVDILRKVKTDSMGMGIIFY